MRDPWREQEHFTLFDDNIPGFTVLLDPDRDVTLYLVEESFPLFPMVVLPGIRTTNYHHDIIVVGFVYLLVTYGWFQQVAVFIYPFLKIERWCYWHIFERFVALNLTFHLQTPIVMNLSLHNHNALICGSSQGIGLAAAHEIAAMGARVTLLARNEEKLEKAAKELPSPREQAHDYIVADFSQPEMVKVKVEEYLRTSGQAFHILVNNTGGPPAGPVAGANVDEFLAAFHAHLINNHTLALSVLPGMKEAGYGRIVNVISTSVKQPLPNLGVSNTIRGAVANWAKTLANEVGRFNITVNNVLPGATATSRLDGIIAGKAKKLGISEEDAAASMLAEIPMQRFGEPAEIANAIAFLASPAAGYINGINLPVDGGRTASL